MSKSVVCNLTVLVLTLLLAYTTSTLAFYNTKSIYNLKNSSFYNLKVPLKYWKHDYKILPAENDTIAYNGYPVICNGGQEVLTLQNIPAGSSIKWFKNGSVIAGANSATYQAVAAGSYSATVTLNGATYTYPPLTLKTAYEPVASFTFPPGIPCSAIALQFTNTSTGGALTYLWNFGDPNSKKSNTSTEANPSHLFVGTPGNGTQTFTVTLTATNKYGCSNVFRSSITLLQAPDYSLGGEGATIYDGLTYFVSCTNAATKFTFINTSTTKNEKYNIFWGDGTGQVALNTFNNISHTYRVGSFNMFYTVYGSNGCSITHKYHIFVGTSPKIVCAVNGPPSVCSGSEMVLQILKAKDNTPGTAYMATYTDGTINNYTSPPDTLMHAFLKNSVNHTIVKNGTTYSNAYGIVVTAMNPCGTATDTIAPIYVSDVPKAKLTLITSDVACANSVVRFKNESDSAFYASSRGAGLNKFIWKISPAAGFQVAANNLGTGNTSNPDAWVSGAKNLAVNFNNPGSYKITLITGNATCGLDSASKIICVNPVPTASFDLDYSTGCLPLTVKVANTSNSASCGKDLFNWAVTYSNNGCNGNAGDYAFVNNTSTTSFNPQIQFNSEGVYTLTLTHTDSLAGCTAAVFSRTVTVQSKPVVSLNVPVQVYVGQAFNPVATINNCIAGSRFVYSWAFNGAANESANVLNPDSVVYKNEGLYFINLTVTNDCGITTVNKSINVVFRPQLYIPNIITPNNDGVNDTWNIKGLETEQVLLQIFNRNGSLLIERRGLYEPWDGTYHNSRLPEGVYYYVIQTLKGKQKYSGSLTLIY